MPAISGPGSAPLGSCGGAAHLTCRASGIQQTREWPHIAPPPPRPSPGAAFLHQRAAGELTFTTKVLNNSFTALNSVQPGGINPKPGQTTGGGGSITGREVQFSVDLTAFNLPADHYSLCRKSKSMAAS